jgi:phosphatidate cytidylyltransferase
LTDPGGGRKAKSGEVAVRVASALVLIFVTIAASVAGGLPFQLFCAAGVLLVLREFLQICWPATTPVGATLAAAGLTATLAGWFFISPSAAAIIAAVFAVLLPFLAAVGFVGSWAVAGYFYTTFPFLALVLLRGDSPDGLNALLLLFGAVWGADTAAFFVGRRFRGPKLAPKISPNKTWSGFFGGLAGAILAMLAIAVAAGYRPTLLLPVVAVLLALATAAGDLSESWIKRRFDKKDSGWIIPGHGGLLDRIDGLIYAAIAAWLLGWLAGGEPLVAGETGRALLSTMATP